ncbi:hypothetical protein CEXT_643401 [Caerostris extrusa]|uniref:Uncharacterized protein n=1 Tax=Caerostris extrusa TaxID=172846 RepID=A0AAV4RHU5_CAEEX|nr:hypothetical protein CEXT_643401 [Caerostris extrusa]
MAKCQPPLPPVFLLDIQNMGSEASLALSSSARSQRCRDVVAVRNARSEASWLVETATDAPVHANDSALQSSRPLAPASLLVA